MVGIPFLILSENNFGKANKLKFLIQKNWFIQKKNFIPKIYFIICLRLSQESTNT